LAGPFEGGVEPNIGSEISGRRYGDLISSGKQSAFGQHKLIILPKYCRECEVLFACHGECPRDRFITTPDGGPALNYLPAGYKLFFNQSTPR
jgi:uncharacterized protein